MQRRITIGAAVVSAFVAIAAVWLLAITRSQAHTLLTQPVGAHTLPEETPEDYGLIYEDVIVTTSDGMRLVGWYVPSRNGAAVMAQHGYKNNRGELLNDAAMLAEHGYGVLMMTVRAHDQSDGERIWFGLKEMEDLEAWYQFLLTRDDVDPARVGILGNSYGGALAIQYAAGNPGIRAVVTQSAFSSLEDTVGTSVSHFADVPRFPFAPLIVFWAEREAGFRAADINTVAWVSKISPRPILLMQGGADTSISPDSGARLYAAAGEPKELWFEPALDHVMFDSTLPDEYEARVVGFFDRYLAP